MNKEEMDRLLEELRKEYKVELKPLTPPRFSVRDILEKYYDQIRSKVDRERKIFITTTSSGIEIPSIIKEFSAADSLEGNNNFFQTEFEGELVFTDENIRNFGELIKLIGGDWEPFISLKHYLKTRGRLPLTKKRTKKILMSRGYSRNDANALLEDIEHRTMSHLDKFFPKNN